MFDIKKRTFCWIAWFCSCTTKFEQVYVTFHGFLTASFQWRRQLDNGGGANMHIFVFCIINLFWNRLFLLSVNTSIYEYSPPLPPTIIELAAPLLRFSLLVLECPDILVINDILLLFQSLWSGHPWILRKLSSILILVWHARLYNSHNILYNMVFFSRELQVRRWP